MPPKGATPQKRETRSGSSTNPITLADIKTLIEDLRTDVINTLKDEVSKLKDTIASLQMQVQGLEDKNRFLQCKFDSFDAELQSLKERPVDFIEAVTSEVENRSRRRCNIVISGLPESSSDDPEESDQSMCADIMTAVSCDTDGFVNVNRIGKPNKTRPRLLKVQCKNFEFRNQLLRRAKELRKYGKYKDIFINPDRTPLEQKHFKELLSELKERKELNENVVIFRNRVVHRRDVKNF